MTRADLTFHVLSTLRREKNPPLARYTLLMAVLRKPRITCSQLASEVGEESAYISGPLDVCVRREWLTRDGDGRYSITPEGEDQIRHLLDPNHVPA